MSQLQAQSASWTACARFESDLVMHLPRSGAGAVCSRRSTHDSPTGTPEFDTGAGPAIHPNGISGMGESVPWPMQSTLELAPLPSAVQCARAHVRLVLTEWGVSGPVDEAELVVSELVTNSVRASAGLTSSWFRGCWTLGTPPVRLWLGSDGWKIVVHVWDGNDKMPVLREPDLEADGGRGLVMVDSISAAWGSYRPAQCSGKTTWAVLT